VYCGTDEVTAPLYVAYLSAINVESVWSYKTSAVLRLNDVISQKTAE